MKFNKLNEEEKKIIEEKATEIPFSGIYDSFFAEGTYICKKCNAPLFSSDSKFDARCGWPSFDESFEKAIKRIPDGMRTEIQCNNCRAHLGHIFLGEKMTAKDIRHCVNSLSLTFIPKGEKLPEVIHE